MAMIRCKQCGRHITDTVRRCPHCGSINTDFRNVLLEKVNEKKAIIIIVLLVVSFGIIGFMLCNKESKHDKLQAEIEANVLTDEEKIGVSDVKKLKSALKNQGVVSVYEIWYRKTITSENQVLIEYSVKNGGSNSTKNVQLIEDGNLLGNDAKADKTISKYTSESDKTGILESKEVRELWDTKGSVNSPFIKLDVDKILRILDKVD